MSQAEWLELYRRLMLYTYKRFGWILNRVGVEPQDLVQQAIKDTFEGRRHWPPIDAETGKTRKDVSLLVFLCNVISSNASHLLEKERKRLTVETPQPSDVDDNLDFGETSSDWLNAFTKESPVKHFELIGDTAADRQVIYGELTDKIRNSVAGDAVLLHIIELLLQSPDLKPKEIAEQLGLSMPQMYTALKRLRRRLHGLREEMKNG